MICNWIDGEKKIWAENRMTKIIDPNEMYAWEWLNFEFFNKLNEETVA